MPVKQQQTSRQKTQAKKGAGWRGECRGSLLADVFLMLFATSGLENSPAAFSTISDLMRLPGCEPDSIAAHLITNDVADLLCQFTFITFNQGKYILRAAIHFVIIFFLNNSSEQAEQDFMSNGVPKKTFLFV